MIETNKLPSLYVVVVVVADVFRIEYRGISKLKRRGKNVRICAECTYRRIKVRIKQRNEEIRMLIALAYSHIVDVDIYTKI